MMPVVRLNDATFADLSHLKTWFGTKTPSETIDHIVREAMDQLGLEREEEPGSVVTNGSGVIEFDRTPSLSFAKPLAASIKGKQIPSPRWSSILVAMIEHVKSMGFEGSKLISELSVPSKAERYEEEGFKYHPTLGISVQGQSANDAWKEVERLSSKWGIPVMVEFWWRHNPKAQYPGKTGIMRSPKQ